MRRRLSTAAALAIFAVLSSSSRTAPAAGWQLVEPMPQKRVYHAAAALGDRWFVAGGESGANQDTQAVDMFDAASGHWTRLGDLASGRTFLVAVADILKRRVLLAGGLSLGAPDGSAALISCNAAFACGISAIPPLARPRYLHAGAFAAGKFVVSGGWGASAVGLDDAEAFDGSGWVPFGTMPGGARLGHTMTALADGTRILVAGGCRPDRAMAEVDLIDAATGVWSRAADLNVPRCRHGAVLLADGRVLVAGSLDGSEVVASAEIFDPAAGAWTPAAPMLLARYDQDIVALPDGRALVAGGIDLPPPNPEFSLPEAEICDPAADVWNEAPPMAESRRWPRVAVLSDGVYVGGGDSVTGGAYGVPSPPEAIRRSATVERLAWADLPPRGADGGEPSDGGSQDAGRDLGGRDTPLDGTAGDAAAGGGAPSGCSCELVHRGRSSSAAGTILWLLLGGMAALRGARPRRTHVRGESLSEAPEAKESRVAHAVASRLKKPRARQGPV